MYLHAAAYMLGRTALNRIVIFLVAFTLGAVLAHTVPAIESWARSAARFAQTAIQWLLGG
jgi:hypothetical protein